MAFISLNKEKRIVAASNKFHCGNNDIEVIIPLEVGGLHNLHNYLYIDGEFIYSPVVEEKIESPSQLDKIEAQITYTAIMTDTLLEE